MTVVHTGKPGRPRKVINPDFLREAMAPGRHIKVSKLAKAIRVSRSHLTDHLKAHKIKHGFSEITNEELDELVRNFRNAKPMSGARYLAGHLRSLGHRVQEHRIKESIARVDNLGRVLRGRPPATTRGKYEVARPNALWHLDGHHKLIRWGVVIHGIVDGYSRTVRDTQGCQKNCSH